MRIGILERGEIQGLERVKKLGFSSMEWVGFADGPCGIATGEWKPYAERLAAGARDRDIRISAIAVLYANPLDPKQSEYARATFYRAIEVAEAIGVKTVAGFPGAVIEMEINERGGNPVYKPFEKHLPQLLEFWEPIARFAAERGIRIAFEHCPQGAYHLPVMGYNMLAQPAMWERLFNSTRCENLGIEWDASHLMCQLIDPVENIRRFGSRIFHVHAKDAFINHDLLKVYGICHPGVADHRMPGLGQANWPEIVHALIRVGYDSDLNIEGWHDPVFRDHETQEAQAEPGSTPDKLAGRKLEDAGILIAKRLLENLTTGTE
ncbi:MAG: sugar phosphate isomerase/epimerase [Verrucomicrobia bacterium]|nr:sugar phosphate isomerase/epimerase [Verrucomicrobiota bacterium]